MGKKPAALAVPAKPDEAPEPTPRTIEGGPSVEPDAYGIYHAANTPVGPRGARVGRGAFTASGTTENRAEQLLISQMQTPERHRGGQNSYLVASPLPNLGSPSLFASPNPVPLFQPSPKRHGLPSPGGAAAGHHAPTGFEALFQSPMRGFNSELQAAADLLRFETPSRHPALDSMISPSPHKAGGTRLAPGSNGLAQGRRGHRGAAFDVAGWRHAEAAAVLGGGDDADADFDLVRNLLQSPGPKEVQALQQEHQRSKLGRSNSSTPAGSPWSSADAAAAAAAGDGGKHVRRRALDFSKAEQMHRDLQAPPNMRRGGSRQHSGSSSGALGSLVDAAAVRGSGQHSADGRDLDRQSHLDQQLRSKFQPHLPLLPLDLSECERHNPSSTTGLTPKGLGGAAAAASGLQRPRQRQQQHGLFADPFTSPRAALDAAAALVTRHAMDEISCMSGSSHDQQQAAGGALRSAALAGLTNSSSKLKSAAAAAAASGASPADGSKGSLPVMVPLDGLSAVAAAGAGGDIAQKVLQLLQGGQRQQQGLGDNAADGSQQEQEAADAEDPDAAGSDGEQAGSQAAAAGAKGRSGSASKRGSQAPRKQTPGSEAQQQQQLQPSRRSRRIAASTPDGARSRDRTASPAPASGSGGSRGRKPVRKVAQADAEQQEQQAEDTAVAMDVDEPEEQQQQLAAEQEAADAAGAQEQQEAETRTRTRSRSGSSRKSTSGKKPSRSRSLQPSSSSQPAASEADAVTGADGDAATAAAAAAAGLAAAAASGLDPAALAQQAAYLPGLQQLAQLQMLGQNFGVTPDKRGGRLPGGLMGPGTPDDMRMAHMGMGYTPSMRSCHCKKSQCLKLYCDCFANNQYCSGCACLDCKNVESNAQEVAAKRLNIQQRDPNAFAHKLAQRADTLTNRKGCKCKKSHCLKKYCECFQLGVRCGDLCKCVDCHNVGEIEGALPLPSAALLQHTALLTASAGQQQQQQRMQHAAAAAAAFWPLGQALPAVSAAGVTPGLAPAQAQLLLRLQAGVPSTPCSAPLGAAPAAAAAVAGLTAAQALAAAGSTGGSADGPAADAAAAHGSTPLAAVASTPQPPKSAGRLSVDQSSLRSTAKPLLPEFMQAAEAGAAAASPATADKFAAEQQQRISSARKMLLHTAAAAAAAEAGEDQLPTPDQAGAEQHLLQLRDTTSGLDAGAAAAAAAAAVEAAGAAAAAAAAARQQYDAATLAGMPVSHTELAAYTGQQQQKYAGSPTGQLQRSPARGKAAASSSSGGDSRAGPVSSAVPGSVTSKGRHRLASSSRAGEDEASTDSLQQHQQLLQRSGLAALVPGAAAGAAAKQSGHLSNARRQLLQQIQEDAASLSDLSAGMAWQQEQQQLVAEQGYALAAALAAAGGHPGADGSGTTSSSSPGQPIMLGPNGPMVVLPQHVLHSAMSQSAAALHMTAGATQPAAQAADEAAAGAPRQTAGMLMTVTDEQGNVQYFFLPNSQAAATAAAAQPSGLQQQQEAEEEEQAGQACAPRARAHKTHHSHPASDPMQVDTSPPAPAAAAAGHAGRLQEQEEQQQAVAAVPQQRMTRRHFHQQQQQQQASFNTPTKSHPQSEGGQDPATAAAAAAGAGVDGRSSRVTPSKRTTPIKRKAEGEDDTSADSPEQLGPSPAKLPHQLSPPSLRLPAGGPQQASPSQPVVLSPVKIAPSALAAGAHLAAAGAEAGQVQSSSRRSLRSARAQQQQQQQQQQDAKASAEQPQQQVLLPAAAPQEMQLFLATTADGQQLLLRAPAGTDPQSLIGADGSVQSCYLAAVLPNTPAPPPQQQVSTASFAQQQQQQLSPAAQRPSRQQQLHVDMPSGTYASPNRVSASPGKVMSPPSASGLLRFSPGKTVFSPKGSSPSKPLLGSSPGRPLAR